MSDISTLNGYNLKDAQARSDISTLNNKIGSANGIAELDANGRVPSSQLPSYVDDVLEYASQSAFPATGETGKIYIALDTNKTFRWSGSAYVEISESLALGETSSTAYAGNKGKANADAITAMKDGSSIDSFGDVETALAGKVDKVTGKGLSTNDYDATAKGIVDNIQDNVIANTQLIADTVGWSNKNNLLNNAVSTGIFTVNGDKSITINGTTSARTTLPLAVVDDNFHPNANNYILSLSETDENVELVIDVYNGSTWIKNIANTKTKANVTIDYDGYDRITAYLLINANVTISNKTVYPMIRKATILDPTYEPYRGTTAFPRDEQRVLGAKNFLQSNAVSRTENTLSITQNNDGTITLDTSAATSSNVAFWINNNVPLKSGRTYIVSGGDNLTNDIIIDVRAYNGNTEVGSIADIRDSGGTIFTPTYSGYDTIKVRGWVRSGTSISNKTIYPMIRLATDPDDTYVPYTMTNRELTELKAGTVTATIPESATLESSKYAIIGRSCWAYLKIKLTAELSNGSRINLNSTNLPTNALGETIFSPVFEKSGVIAFIRSNSAITFSNQSGSAIASGTELQTSFCYPI